ncbi:hypothetical protein BVC80_8509g5 [Macleaya cordata]|uniref:Reverse transcriptase zinc-binding domain n=1 Tax=Macleaya cordata TaxID=56857 RepID=A0A200QAM1_MACCD|nr:hypothetical protein BVC80_8509g5 [Macleaya cordata]
MSQGVGVWKKILKERDLIFQNSNLEVHDGKSVYFWWDLWCGPSRLKDRFPSIYKISRKKYGAIADVVSSVDNRVTWELDINRVLNEDELRVMNQLMQVVGMAPMLLESDDVFNCSLANDNVFSAKACYKVLINEGETCPVSNLIWNKEVPSKMKRRFPIFFSTRRYGYNQDHEVWDIIISIKKTLFLWGSTDNVFYGCSFEDLVMRWEMIITV